MMKTCLFSGLLLLCVGLSAQDAASQLTRMQVAMRENERMFMEQLQRAKAVVDQLQESNHAMSSKIEEFNRRLSAMESRNRELDAEVKQLRQLISAESTARHESMRKFAGEVGRQMSAVAESKPSSRSSSTSGGPATEGEFFEYEVQRGATLNAIAKAYEVSVDDIRKANRLKNDNIVVGQKLYIPKKK